MLNERFSDRRQRLLRLKVMREGGRLPSSSRIDAPAIFEQCPACGEAVSKRQWADQLYVCPHCGHHRPIGAYQRLALTLDSGTFQTGTSTSISRSSFIPFSHSFWCSGRISIWPVVRYNGFPSLSFLLYSSSSRFLASSMLRFSGSSAR